MSYFKKGHTHKPKKGKGSYDREVVSDPREIEEASRKDQEWEDEQCLANTTTVDGATRRKG